MTRTRTEKARSPVATPASSRHPIRALLVEDDPDAARLATRRLESAPDADLRVSHESTLADALARLEEETFDVMILDVGLPDVEGSVTLAHASLISRHLPVVVLTGNSDTRLFLQALRAGCQEYLVKEVQGRESLAQAVVHAVARSPGRRGTSASG